MRVETYSGSPAPGAYGLEGTIGLQYVPAVPRVTGRKEINSFSEFDNTEGPEGGKRGDTWFAFDVERPLAFFAGIWVPQWTSVRKIKEGLVTTDLFAFLTCEPNDIVGSIHMKAMPVIVTAPE